MSEERFGNYAGNEGNSETAATRTSLNTMDRNQDLENEIVRALSGLGTKALATEQLSELTGHSVPQVEVALAYLKSDWVVKSAQTRRGEVVALSDTRVARELALLLTKNHTAAPGSFSDCKHHWMLEGPDGEVTRGVCRSCGAERYFLSSLSALHRGARAVVFTSETAPQR